MTVFLVGAGPGDPDLLTVRAARLLADADVVVADRLVGARVRALVNAGARVVDVGKRARSGDPSLDQSAINALLIEAGREGGCVVRLKGGDPFVFGRGAEEVDALTAAGVAVEVVPGVSSAFAIPALAGIPVTVRGTASSVTVASGHAADDSPQRWAALAQTGGTLVLLMAVANRGAIAAQLVAGGLDPSTPVAAITWGATPAEVRVATTLGRLGTVEVAAPAVIVVGDVAAMMAPLERRGASAKDEQAGGRPATRRTARRAVRPRRPAEQTP